MNEMKSEILSELKEIKDSLNTLKSKVECIEDTLSKVIETQEKQETQIKRLKADVLSVKESQEMMMAEIDDRDRRKPNLVISGIPECVDGNALDRKKWDTEKVENLFRALDDLSSDQIAQIHRIGKVGSSRPRILRIVCNDAKARQSLLRKAKNLRAMPEYANVFINPDLTPSQQREQKRLREELKRRKNLGEDVIIRHGKVASRTVVQNFQ